MNSTEERSGGGSGAMQLSRCFYETFRDDRIHYFGPTSAYWKSRAQVYREIERSRVEDVISRVLLRTNFVCLHIDAFLRDVDAEFDFVVLNNSRLGYVASAVRKRTRLLMTWYVNIEIDYIRHKYRSKLLTQLDLAIFKLREAQCARLSDCSLFITQRDLRRHDEVYGPTRYAMLPIATPERTVTKKQSSAVRLAFMGSFSYRPNLDAAEYLLNELLPRTSHRLLLAGSDPPRAFVAQVEAQRDRIDFHPNFATLDGVLSDRDVFVSPLALGAGMKVKVSDSISMGIPILGSEETFVGYERLPHIDYLTCRSVDDYLARIEDLSNPERYAEITRDLYASWKEHYSMDASVKMFAQAYRELAQA
jgi:glycosyltransferase involved in cell wall biosynthesis